MGGDIWLESELGQGSRFHFTVKLGRMPEQAMNDAASPRRVLEHLRVLAVDDNATNRRLLSALLGSWGIDAMVVDAGAAAWSMLKAARQAGRAFDLVILDGHMPDMDGFMVAEAIRHDPSLAGVTLMMLASDRQVGDAARCRDLGVKRFLTKPVTPSELLDAILFALGSSTRAPVDGPVPAERPLGHRRVLVAEDNGVNQLLAVRLLEKLGYRAQVVSSGLEALAALEDGVFDLVLMDVQMPEMDGLTATARIRQREVERGRPRVPIVALTAHALLGDRERCLAADMDDYLAKPVKLADLTRVVERLLGELTPLEPADVAAG
jgi:CheY-like chemotaxis protein